MRDGGGARTTQTQRRRVKASPEVPPCEGVAGARLEICLESFGFGSVRESQVGNEAPWLELGGVAGLAGIVLREALAQIRGRADVPFPRRAEAFQKVDVLH